MLHGPVEGFFYIGWAQATFEHMVSITPICYAPVNSAAEVDRYSYIETHQHNDYLLIVLYSFMKFCTQQIWFRWDASWIPFFHCLALYWSGRLFCPNTYCSLYYIYFLEIPWWEMSVGLTPIRHTHTYSVPVGSKLGAEFEQRHTSILNLLERRATPLSSIVHWYLTMCDSTGIHPFPVAATRSKDWLNCLC